MAATRFGTGSRSRRDRSERDGRFRGGPYGPDRKGCPRRGSARQFTVGPSGSGDGRAGHGPAGAGRGRVASLGGGSAMTYWVYYGDPAAMGQRDLRQDEGIRSERFSTDWEALRRARELLDEDATT